MPKKFKKFLVKNKFRKDFSKKFNLKNIFKLKKKFFRIEFFKKFKIENGKKKEKHSKKNMEMLNKYWRKIILLKKTKFNQNYKIKEHFQ